jgi:hypothetical protein
VSDSIEDEGEQDEAPGAEPDFSAPRQVDPRALPARIHNLKAAGLSGAHALFSFQPQGDTTETLARRLGSAAHALLFGKPIVIYDEPSDASIKRRDKAMAQHKPLPPLTKAQRKGDQWKRFQSAHVGKLIVAPGELAKAQRIVDAIHGHPIAERLLFGPGMTYEQSIIWAELGRARQSTPDARGPSHNVELKTTRCAAPFAFGRDAERMGYHAQLADQRAAIAYERQGRAPRESYIVAVENVPPYVVQVYEVPASLLEAGDKLRLAWAERLQMFEATDMWRGYSDRIETLEFPERREPMMADPSWAAESDDNNTEGTGT